MPEVYGVRSGVRQSSALAVVILAGALVTDYAWARGRGGSLSLSSRGKEVL